MHVSVASLPENNHEAIEVSWALAVMEEAPIPSDSLHTEPISSIRVMHPDNNTVHGDQT